MKSRVSECSEGKFSNTPQNSKGKTKIETTKKKISQIKHELFRKGEKRMRRSYFNNVVVFFIRMRV